MQLGFEPIWRILILFLLRREGPLMSLALDKRNRQAQRREGPRSMHGRGLRKEIWTILYTWYTSLQDEEEELHRYVEIQASSFKMLKRAQTEQSQ